MEQDSLETFQSPNSDAELDPKPLIINGRSGVKLGDRNSGQLPQPTFPIPFGFSEEIYLLRSVDGYVRLSAQGFGTIVSKADTVPDK